MTQANSLKSTYTADQFLEWYENQEGTFELIEGEIYMTPSPSFTHQDVISLITFIIREYLNEHPIGKIVPNFDFYINNINYYNPDLSYFSRETIETHNEILLTEDFKKVKPSLVIEVVSKSRKHIDYKKKRDIYESLGVPEYWIVDPMEKRFTFLQLKDGKYMEIKAKGDIYISNEIGGFKLDINLFWNKISMI